MCHPDSSDTNHAIKRALLRDSTARLENDRYFVHPSLTFQSIMSVRSMGRIIEVWYYFGRNTQSTWKVPEWWARTKSVVLWYWDQLSLLTKMSIKACFWFYPKVLSLTLRWYLQECISKHQVFATNLPSWCSLYLYTPKKIFAQGDFMWRIWRTFAQDHGVQIKMRDRLFESWYGFLTKHG